MTEFEKQKLGKILWAIADKLRGAMNADDFRDYMLAFLFLRYLSDNDEAAAQKELGQTTRDRSTVRSPRHCSFGTKATTKMCQNSRSRCAARCIT